MVFICISVLRTQCSIGCAMRKKMGFIFNCPLGAHLAEPLFCRFLLVSTPLDLQVVTGAPQLGYHLTLVKWQRRITRRCMLKMDLFIELYFIPSQNLSNRFLNAFVDGALMTSFGRLFQSFTARIANDFILGTLDFMLPK